MYRGNGDVADARKKALTARLEEYQQLKPTEGAKRFADAFAKRTTAGSTRKPEESGGKPPAKAKPPGG